MNRGKPLSLRVTDEMRRTVERLTIRLATKRDRRVSMTDVLEEAIRLLAKKEKVHV